MTNYLEAVPWDLLASGFQLALCAGILFGWVRRRIRRRSAAPGEPAAAPPIFAREMLLQTIRQQTEQAWQNIRAAVEAERDRLQHTLAGAASPTPEAEPGGSADAFAAFRWGDPEPDGPGPSRYDEVDALAAQGLNTRQIADRMKRPAGEIELALKMRQGRHENHPAEATRQ